MMNWNMKLHNKIISNYSVFNLFLSVSYLFYYFYATTSIINKDNIKRKFVNITYNWSLNKFPIRRDIGINMYLFELHNFRYRQVIDIKYYVVTGKIYKKFFEMA